MTYISIVKEKNRLTPKIFELTLKLQKPKKVNFIAGQYVPFVIGNQTRLYSMTSSPKNSSELSFCIDVEPNGVGSKFILKLKAGDVVRFKEPLGFFAADEHSKDILFVATGAGIAPYKSMIPELLESGFKKKVSLLFGVRNMNNLFFADFFEELDRKYKNFDFITTLSQPEKQWSGKKGRVTDFLNKNAAKYKKHLVYICGSPGAAGDIQDLLISRGFLQKNIRMEVFE